MNHGQPLPKETPRETNDGLNIYDKNRDREFLGRVLLLNPPLGWIQFQTCKNGYFVKTHQTLYTFSTCNLLRDHQTIAAVEMASLEEGGFKTILGNPDGAKLFPCAYVSQRMGAS